MDAWLYGLAPAASTLAGVASVAILAFVLAGGLLRLIPALGSRVLGTQAGRSGELDGLRGGLCLLVLLHHCIIVRTYYATGDYTAPAGNFDNLAGEAAVALFFLTTAYLYWRRMLRGGRFGWPALIKGRLRRLGPMYVASVAVLVAIVMAESGFTLHESLLDLGIEILHWLSFDFLSLPDINALPDTYHIQVVLWTLRYEWMFVLCLPLLGWFASGRRPIALYLGGLGFAALVDPGDSQMFVYFLAGLIAADLHLRLEGRVSPRLWGGIGLAALAVLLGAYRNVYGGPQIVLLTLVFLGACSGSGPWAILRNRALQFLGLISYSVYLLHHMVLHVAAARLIGAERFAALDDWQFQVVVVLIGTAVIGLSVVTFLTIERPWLHVAPKPAPQGESLVPRPDSPRR